MRLSLKLALVPARKMPIWSRNCPFFFLFAMKRERWSPFLLIFYTGYGYKKNILKEKKIWLVEVAFFTKNDVKYRILETHQLNKRKLDFSIFHRFVFVREWFLTVIPALNIPCATWQKLRITGSRGEIKHGDPHPFTADFQSTDCQLDQV